MSVDISYLKKLINNNNNNLLVLLKDFFIYEGNLKVLSYIISKEEKNFIVLN